jgi:hypothetical protein
VFSIEFELNYLVGTIPGEIGYLTGNGYSESYGAFTGLAKMSARNEEVERGGSSRRRTIMTP